VERKNCCDARHCAIWSESIIKVLQVFIQLTFFLPLVSCDYSYITYEFCTTLLERTSAVPLKTGIHVIIIMQTQTVRSTDESLQVLLLLPHGFSLWRGVVVSAVR